MSPMLGSDAYTVAFESFVKVLTRRLVEKGVFTSGEMVDLLDLWFGEVVRVAATQEEHGSPADGADEVLKMIHLLTDEFTTK